MVAAFGVSLVSTVLVNYKTWFHVIGAAFLCYLGVKTFLTKPLAEERSMAASSSGTLIRTFFTTFLLTLANPLTILSFGGVYAGVDLDRFANGEWSPWVLVSGVFIGSALWWLLLSWGAAFLGKMLNFKPNAWLNRLSGSVILLFGFMTLIPLFFI
jgi:threonine/homoserine/homoserine lactone efflux protein